MAGLGYPCYGLNVLNVNGETSDLPVCRLFNINGAQTIGASGIIFAEGYENLPGMLVNNQGANSGTYSAVRTPVSGIYEIEGQILMNAASAGTAELDILIDKKMSFGSNGEWLPNGSYYGSLDRLYLAGAVQSSLSCKRTLFLEKDCYICLYGNTVSGGTITATSSIYSAFSVKCISAENAQKLSTQT